MTSDLSKTGILLLSHGSRLDQGKKVIEAYTQMYKEEFPEAIVEYGFMEMREPNIPQSINKLTNGNDLEKNYCCSCICSSWTSYKKGYSKIIRN